MSEEWRNYIEGQKKRDRISCIVNQVISRKKSLIDWNFWSDTRTTEFVISLYAFNLLRCDGQDVTQGHF